MITNNKEKISFEKEIIVEDNAHLDEEEVKRVVRNLVDSLFRELGIVQSIKISFVAESQFIEEAIINMDEQ